MRTHWPYEQSDEWLAQRMTQGDAAAFAELATRYWSNIHRVCSNMLSEPSDAAEAAETIMSLAARPAEPVRGGASFKTSLYRLAMRNLLGRMPVSPDGSVTFLPRFDVDGRLTSSGLDWSQFSEVAFRGLDVKRRIREALQRLDPAHRAAFVLREIEELDDKEVAAVLGIPPRTVRQRAHRAWLMLTGFLGHLFEKSAVN